MVEGLTVLEGRYGIASPPLAPELVEAPPKPARKAALREAPDAVSLTPPELDLLDFWRPLPPEQQRAVLGYLRELAADGALLGED